MRIKFLGTHNAESKDTRLVSFLIDDVIAVEAGSLSSELTFKEQAKVKYILLTHGHYDHIRAVPAFVFSNSSQLTRVYASSETLQILSSHLIDGIIYPEFTSDTSFLGQTALEMIPVVPFEPQEIGGYRVTAIPVRHPVGGIGFEISSSDGKSLFYTGDTGPGLAEAWEKISPQMLIADVSLPNRLATVASEAQHLCPEMLAEELAEFRRIRNYLPEIYIIHMSPQYESEIAAEVGKVAGELGISINIAREGETCML